MQHHRLLSLEDLLLVEWLAAERVHQVQQELAYHRQLLLAILRGEGKIIEGEGKIMTAVQVEQEDIDAVANDLKTQAGVIGAQIQALEDKINANQPITVGDLSGLKAGQGAIDALVVPAATPPADTTPPADGGDTGTDTGSGDASTPPADGSTPPADTSTPPADDGSGDAAPVPVNDVPET